MALSYLVAFCIGFTVSEAFVEVSKEATSTELPPLFGIQVGASLEIEMYRVLECARFDV